MGCSWCSGGGVRHHEPCDVKGTRRLEHKVDVDALERHVELRPRGSRSGRRRCTPTGKGVDRSEVHVVGRSTRPSTVIVQVAVSTRGVTSVGRRRAGPGVVLARRQPSLRPLGSLAEEAARDGHAGSYAVGRKISPSDGRLVAPPDRRPGSRSSTGDTTRLNQRGWLSRPARAPAPASTRLGDETALGASTCTRGRIRSSQAGSHQLRSPSRVIVAGTRIIRTKVASREMAVAIPNPIILITTRRRTEAEEHRDHDRRRRGDQAAGRREPRATHRGRRRCARRPRGCARAGTPRSPSTDRTRGEHQDRQRRRHRHGVVEAEQPPAGAPPEDRGQHAYAASKEKGSSRSPERDHHRPEHHHQQ